MENDLHQEIVLAGELSLTPLDHDVVLPEHIFFTGKTIRMHGPLELNSFFYWEKFNYNFAHLTIGNIVTMQCTDVHEFSTEGGAILTLCLVRITPINGTITLKDAIGGATETIQSPITILTTVDIMDSFLETYQPEVVDETSLTTL